jgi:MFS family permease
VIAISAFAALGGFLFLSTLYLQNVRGLSALHAGLWMLPMAVPIVLCAPLSGRLVGNRGPRLSLVIAGVAMTVSAVLFAAFDAETSDVTLFIAYVVFGIGFGFVNAPITNTAVSGMPRAQAGVAAAVASTSRQLGQTLGVAVVGSVLASGVGASSYRSAFVSASVPGWWVLVLCGGLVLVFGAVTSGRWARRTAERTAERLEAVEVREAAGVTA